MKHITCIEDLREVHRRKVPKAFFDYADRGSYSEETLRANRDDLQQIKFRQRILVDVSKRDLSTTILGEPASLPLMLAPIGAPMPRKRCAPIATILKQSSSASVSWSMCRSAICRPKFSVSPRHCR